MRIISEITGKEYKTVEECLAAEEEFEAKVAAEKAEKERLKLEKESRREEIQAAYINYVELRDAYIKDYKEPIKIHIRQPFDSIVNMFGDWGK